MKYLPQSPLKRFVLAFVCYFIVGLLPLIAQGKIKRDRPRFATNDLSMDKLINSAKNDPNLAAYSVNDYVHKEWRPGVLFLQTGNTLKAYDAPALRYNVAKNRVEIGESLQSTKVIGYYDNRRLARFKIQDPRTKSVEYYVRCNLLDLPDRYRGFAEVLYQGKKVVLYKKTIVLVKNDNQEVVRNHTLENTAVKKYRYYLKTKKGVIRLIKRKKFVLAQMGDKASQVKAFAKANKFRYRKDKDLVTLFKYFDAL